VSRQSHERSGSVVQTSKQATFQTRTELSKPHVASDFLSGENTTPKTRSWCPDKTVLSPPSKSHSLTGVSRLAVAAKTACWRERSSPPPPGRVASDPPADG